MTNDRSRKQDIRDRMRLTGEPYSVAARNLCSALTPQQAFFKSYGTVPENVNFVLKSWTVPVYQLLVSTWEGDTKILEEIGAEYAKLDAEGHYFCHHHKIIESLLNSFSSLTFMFNNKDIPKAWEDLKKKQFDFYTQGFREEFDAAYANNSLDGLFLMNRVNELLRENMSKAKDSRYASHEGVYLLQVFWRVIQQSGRAAFAWNLLQTLKSMPEVEQLNTPDVFYTRYFQFPPQKKMLLAENDKVKFADDGSRVWKVVGISENFTVLHTSSGLYTIVDWNRGFRGTHNSYSQKVTTKDEVEETLRLLELKLHHDNTQSSGLELGRNQVALRIESVN